MCIIPRSEEEIAAIPDFQDVVVRGGRYSMLYVVLGLPPRCHRCKVRGHLAYQCVACRYCGSGSHTSEEHSVENARRREFSAVVEGTQGIRDFETEEGEMEERGQVEEQLVNASQPGPVTQLINDMSEEEREGDGKEEDKEGSGGEGEIKVTEETEGSGWGVGWGGVGGWGVGGWGVGGWGGGGVESESEGSGEGEDEMSQKEGKEGERDGKGDGEGIGMVSGEGERGKEGKEGWEEVKGKRSWRRRVAGKDDRSCSRSSSGGRGGKRACSRSPLSDRSRGGGMGKRERRAGSLSLDREASCSLPPEERGKGKGRG